jgi:cytoskeletal protein RodZ
VRAPGAIAEVESPAKPEQHPGFKLGISIALGVLVIVLGAGGFLAWKFLLKADPVPEAAPNSSAPSAPASPATATVPETSVPTAPASPAPTKLEPERLKISELMAAAQREEQARVDALARGEAPPEKNSSTRPAPADATASNPDRLPALTKAPDSVVATPLAPGVTANMAAPPISVHDASPEFRAFVANAKITGVFQGEGDRGRAFINGRIARTGDTIDASLGIFFDGIDPQRKMIIFKDRTGAIATRKY